MSKRDAILSDIADFILERGLEAATLRALATATGQSDRMLLYYFPDKAALIEAALGVLEARYADALAGCRVDGPLRKDALHEALDQVILSEGLWPYLRLSLEVAAQGSREEAAPAAAARRLGECLHGWIEAQLATAQADQRRTQATEIMIGLQGVVMLKAAGLEDYVRELV